VKPIVTVPRTIAEVAQRAGLETRALVALVQAGAFGIESPRRLAAIAGALRSYGPYGSAVRIAAIRRPDAPALWDERGELTYRELDDQVNQLTNAFLALGLQPGDSVGILCRNHRAPLLAGFAASRAGLRCLWLNTAFSPRQAAEVVEREGVDLLVHDDALADLVSGLSPRFGLYAATLGAEPSAFDELVASGDPSAPPAPASPGRIILLTSGTTGTPKGAPRTEPKGLVVPGSVLERMPMKSGETTVMGPPLFHGTGMLLAMVTIALGNKLVLRPRFDPVQLLDDLEAHAASTACLVPVMLQRALELGDDEVRRRDLSALRVVFCAGSQLPAQVSTHAQELLGDVIYNLYGSTEVSIATIATPEDVHQAPTSVGRPALGVRIRILDEQGNDLPTGQTGRIFVGATMQFEGYTGGGHKDVVDGLMASGDVGHFDEDGRLHIDGRDDEMIVSGGENVFPREVEELLVTHPAIADAAVIGVEDEQFGQRLRAFCVRRAGHELDAEAVQVFVKDNLARYKSPRDVVFLDELPRNPTGKVLKRELTAYTLDD
jgi:fatty-acyl-CoA synthase